MITSGPEFNKFLVEPGMEIEPFDPKLTKEIFLNHPYKILINELNKDPPNYSRWGHTNIIDFYFKMLDDMVKKLVYRINEGNDDYLGIIRD